MTIKSSVKLIELIEIESFFLNIIIFNFLGPISISVKLIKSNWSGSIDCDYFVRKY